MELKDTHIDAFKILLKYIYTGKVHLGPLKEDLLIEILGLAHKYGFNEFEIDLSAYLKV